MGVETVTASLGIDSSSTTFQDYQVTSYTANTTLTGSISLITASYKLMVRALIENSNVISTFRAYPLSNTYNITATLSNTKIAGMVQTVTSSVLIAQGITNLQITSPPMCERNVSCTLSSSIATGTQVSYYWNFTDAYVVTNSSSLTYLFTTFGVRLQYLVANNTVCGSSRRVYSQNITISEKINNLRFCSGTYCSNGVSSSVVGAPANFYLLMDTGRDYNCLIDFGDSQQLSIDYNTVFNGSLISHNYMSIEGAYYVTITCSNYLNSQTFKIQHYVQYLITNVHVTTKGALKNTPFYVGFALGTGTYASISFVFNFNKDNLIAYNEVTKIGSSSWHSALPPCDFQWIF